MTLLEKARTVAEQDHPIPSNEQIELAIAWLKNSVSINQIARATGKAPTSAYLLLARALRQAYRQGIIKT
jgi:hypothetical protein